MILLIYSKGSEFMAKFCPMCGTNVADNATNCPMCGGLINNQQPQQDMYNNQMMNQQPNMYNQPMMNQQPNMYNQPMMGQQPNMYNNQPMMGQQLPSDGLAIASLCCGIFGFLCITPVGLAGLICGFMSLNNIKEGKVKPNLKAMSIIGIILSFAALAILVYRIIDLA